jgi:hypothetical protein
VGCGAGRLDCYPSLAGLCELKEKGRGKWAAAGPGRRAVREGKRKREEEQGGPAEDSGQTDFGNRNTFGFSNPFTNSYTRLNSNQI